MDHLHRHFDWPRPMFWPLWPFLWLLSLVYGGVVRLRNLRWDLFPPKPVSSAYVISVGNLSAGGTGKTPMGMALALWLEKRGRCVEVVLRGNGAKNGFSDEAQLYRDLLGATKVHQASNRGLALRTMVSAQCEVVILDDAFQHRQAHRDLDLVLWDLSAPAGERRVLPLGLLREPLSGLTRADAVVMTRSDAVTKNAVDLEKQLFMGSGWGQAQFLASSRPRGLREWPSGKTVAPDATPCLLVSGIGRPEAFKQTAEKFGLVVAGVRWFADHHPFSEEDIEGVYQEAQSVGAKRVVITAKDAVKWKGHRAVVVLDIEMDVEEGFWLWVEARMEQGRD